jgi:hypothetical protein
MSDEELVRALEAGRMPAEGFPHASHVRAAWWYLSHYPLAQALDRFCTTLKQFAAAQGKPDRYHETITIAYLLLINERLDDGRGLDWPQFAATHPDLLQWKPSVLERYYSPGTLASDRARRVFVMPDLV